MYLELVNSTARKLFFSRALVSLVAAALAVTACSSKTETAERKAGEAAALLDAGDIDGARKAALASVEARDDQPETWMLLGRIGLAKNAMGEAYDAYTRAIELDSSNIEALQALSELALQSGRMSQSLKYAEQLIAFRPDLSRPKLIKGFIALRRNDPEEANRLADEIIAIDPGEDAGAVLKARLLARKGDLATAEKMLSDRAEPGELVLGTLAEVRRKSGNGVGLEQTLTRLVELAATNDRIFDLAAVRYKLGRVDDARNVIFDRLAARPLDAGLYDRATNFLLEVDPDVFDAARIQSITESDLAPLHEFAARILLERGRAQEAKDVLQPLMAKGFTPDGWSLYATALYNLGARADAQGLIDGVLEADETNAYALLLRSRLNMDKRDLNAALQDAQAVVRDDPQSLQGRLLVIEIYRQRGDLARARRLFEQAAIDLPQNIRLSKAFIAFLRQTRDPVRAREIAETYTQINPARLKGWDMLLAMCDDALCKKRADYGRQTALTAFTPDDQLQLGGNGLFGRL